MYSTIERVEHDDIERTHTEERNNERYSTEELLSSSYIYIYYSKNTTYITYTTTIQCLLYTILRHNTKVSWLDY